MTGAAAERPRRANPFPATPVAGARLGASITTSALRELSFVLDDYATDPTKGVVIAVTGEVGAGKTHLAHQLSLRARDLLPEALLVRVEARAGFRALYGRILDELGSNGLRSQADRYHYDAVVDFLRDTGIPDLLPADRPLDPRRLAEFVKLPESTLWVSVERRISRVTGDADLGAAIGMLVHPGSTEQVWSWLRGTTPGASLPRRDIGARAVDTDEKALAALGTLARLFAGHGRGFALVVDEADHLFPPSRQRADIVPFQELLEVFVQAGAFMVLCGTADFLVSLPDATRDRIAHVVAVEPLQRAEAEELVNATLGHASGAEVFGESAVDRLHEAAAGNPRRFLRLCHHLFAAVERNASTTEVSVTDIPVTHSPATDELVDKVVRRFDPPLAVAGPKPPAEGTVADRILARLDAIERLLADLVRPDART